MTSDLERIGRYNGVFFTADELVNTDFPEPKWAVHGLLAEGLTLLAGAPKLGKSWMALGLGLSIAAGEKALGSVDTDEGDVLYCALEDTPRRLKSRLHKMLGGRPAPSRLSIVTNLPEMPEAVNLIATWLDLHPEARLVVVDVLGKVRPPQGNADRYEQDYKVISSLKQLADNYSVAIVAVTHVRKMADGDVFNTVSGSTGLTGAADTTLVLRRTRGSDDAELHITGRDVEESEYSVTFSPDNGAWTMYGNALADAAARMQETRATAGLGDKSADVVAYVNRQQEGVRAADVATALGFTDKDAGTYLLRAERAGRIRRVSRGVYGSVGSVGSVGSDPATDAHSYTSNTSYTSCTACNEPIDPAAGTVHPLCDVAA